VRVEVESGLKRDDVLVIPVLVMGATMPSAEQLPESLCEPAYRHAAVVREDPDFNRDVSKLVQQITQQFEARAPHGPQPTLSKLLSMPRRTQVTPGAQSTAVLIVSKPPDAGQGVTAVANTRMPWINVRSGPGTDYADIGDLIQYTEVIYYPGSRTYQGWVWVEQDGLSGWVNAEFITFEEP
jgi:hypothetical protein